jgi:GNAT superfamily N-acetyltransferase
VEDKPQPPLEIRIVEIRIERATIEHIELVAPLLDAYRQFYDQPSDVTAAESFLRGRLYDGSSVVFLAVSAADAATGALGFTQLYPSFSSLSLRPIWILYDLFVTPAARRRGVGGALLEHARHFATATGAGELTLQTAVTNRAAQALYVAHGWKRDDEYDTYTLQL